MERNLDANFLGDCDVTSNFGSPGYDWLPIVKNEDAFNKFNRAYMRDHGKIHSISTDFCQKCEFLFSCRPTINKK